MLAILDRSTISSESGPRVRVRAAVVAATVAFTAADGSGGDRGAGAEQDSPREPRDESQEDSGLGAYGIGLFLLAHRYRPRRHIRPQLVGVDTRDGVAGGRACELAGRARCAGKTIPASDIVIFTCAVQHGVEIEHADAHFDMLKEL